MPAPKGNQNALKHGLYARHFPEQIKKSFLRWDLDDYAAEIQLLRYALDKLASCLSSENVDEELLVKVNIAMAHVVSSLVRASRQHILFNAEDNPILVAWFDVCAGHDFLLDGTPPDS
jgi:hypothetical protein